MKTFLYIIPSIFTKHVLAPKHNIALVREDSYNIPVFISLLVCSILLIYIYLRYHKKIAQIFLSLISYAKGLQIQREGYSFFRSFSVPLLLIYVISTSVFFADLNIYTGLFNNLSFEFTYGLFAIVIILILVIKRAINNLLGFIAKEKIAGADCSFQYALNIYIGGFILFIICLLSHYSNLPARYLFPAGIGAIGFLFMIRIIKILALGYMQYGFSLFHLVLYLCAVEIIPLTIFIKLIVRG